MGFFLECGSCAFCPHTGKFFTGKRGKLSVTQTCSTWQTTEKSRAQTHQGKTILFSSISVNSIPIFFFNNSYICVATKSLFIMINFFFLLWSALKMHSNFFLLMILNGEIHFQNFRTTFNQQISFLLRMHIADNL